MTSTGPDPGLKPPRRPPPSGSRGRHRLRTRSSYRDLARIPEFRAVWSAQAFTYLGEQVAQVALAILVYIRTGSAMLTAVTYALAYLPPIAGRPLLAGLAEVIPARRLIITIDLVRAGLVGVMALPVLPLYGVCTLLFAIVLLGSPLVAARSAVLPAVLPSGTVVLGAALSNITFHASQIVGFLVGGTLVAALGAHSAIALDTIPFAVSAAITARGMATRPPAGAAPRPGGFRAALGSGSKLVFTRPELRVLVLFGWLAGFTVVPEGLAAPYAHALGGGPFTVGMLMSAMPVGMVTGAFIMSRLTDEATRLRITGWLAVLSCAPLGAGLLHPPLWALLCLWILAGMGMSYQLTAASAFVRALPAGTSRGQAFMVAQTGLLAAQGIAILIAGAAAQRDGAGPVVALAGLLGMTVAGVLATSWARHSLVLVQQLPDMPDTVGDSAA